MLVANACSRAVRSVSRGADHQAEADRPGLQSQLLAGQSLQVGPAQVPLQRRQRRATCPRGAALLPAALPGVGRASRYSPTDRPTERAGRVAAVLAPTRLLRLRPGRVVSGECQGEMMDYRRMLMEDFSLSPEIVLHCRAEIEGHCSGLHRKGRTLHCLMRVGRGDAGAVDPNCQRAVSTPAAGGGESRTEAETLSPNGNKCTQNKRSPKMQAGKAHNSVRAPNTK